jgi:two-component system, chemotaxis family, CheB/CheR fusion protein
MSESDRQDVETMSPYVVGVGASAGGLEALRVFFGAMPEDSGLAFVVIQHLAPDHKSLMVELLQRATSIPVCRAEQDMAIKPNHIFLIPPRFNLTLEKGLFKLTPSPAGKSLNLPIDIFFRSLALECADRAVAVVLSGTGSDGARGIRTVKEAGGMIMVQAEASAKFAGMPASAIATGAADFVLPVEEMASQLVNFSRHPFATRAANAQANIPENSTHLERICTRLREAVGIDFAHYKHATFARRIERRMNILQIQDINDYVQCLVQSGTEASQLGKELLIGVTKFFRDGEAFRSLMPHLEDMFSRAAAGECLRIWSAACSTGEEAYTLAMLCEEIRSARYPHVEFKVFATDVDKSALDIAGAGIYPRSVVADLPSEYLEKYFQPEGNENFRIHRGLRDRLIFAKQDLLTDPPFTKLHLVTCRNLLIYLRPAAQRKLLGLFHFSLISRGILFLGSSETLGDLAYAFEIIDSKYRVYRKAMDVPLKISDSIPSLTDNTSWLAGADEGRRFAPPRRGSSHAMDTIQQHLLNRFAPATLVMNQQFQLLYTLGPIADYLKFAGGPVNLDVMKMVNRDLGLAISSSATQALREKRVVEFRAIRLADADAPDAMASLRAEAFDSRSEHGQVILITFQRDDFAAIKPDTGSENFDQQQQLLARIQSLEEDLLTTRENLQASVEQQETANEELQAANEELLAANEELQSTNEELESVNEELYTVNAEYQGKIQELTEVNDDMANFARSTDIGTIFFDSELQIRRFTPAFARMTHLTDTDVGRNISTFGHPVLMRIMEAAPKLLRQQKRLHEEMLELHPDGTFLLRIIPYRVEKNDVQGLVASLVDVSRISDAEEELRKILQTVDVGICVTDENGCFVQVNEAYCRIYGYQGNELIGRHFSVVVPEEDRDMARKLHDDFTQGGVEMPAIWQVIDKTGRKHRIAVKASLMKRADGTRRKITVVTDFEDVEAMHRAAHSEADPL